MTRIAVIGAGPGALTVAVLLAEAGHEVTIWNRSAVRLRDNVPGTVELFDGLQVGPVPVATTTHIADAVAGAECVAIVLPASGHRAVAQMLVGNIAPDVPVLLMPGRTAGALEVFEVLGGNPVVEAQTLPFGCRIVEPGRVRIFATKVSVPLAGIRADQVRAFVQDLLSALPSRFPWLDSTLITSLGNVGAMIHPSFMLSDGSLQDFARIAATVDAERQALAAAYGVGCRSLSEWLAEIYGATGSLDVALSQHPVWGRFPKPDGVDHRYLTEDVPTGLVPMAGLGSVVGLDLPEARRLIDVAGRLLGRDFRAEGRTLERLGLSGADRDMVLDAFRDGSRVIA